MNAATNTIILEGDCLRRLPELAAERLRFSLIYLDPPFCAGGKRGARIGGGARADGVGGYIDNWGGIESFLEMLEPRLQACRELLARPGSLWLHLDHRAVHEAKIVVDRVFGRKAFRGEIIWVPGNGGRRTKGPSMTHQTLLVYASPGGMLWNADDPALREPFAETSLRMHFKQRDADGRRYRERTVNGKSYRYYADEGRRIGSVWADCPAMNANTPLTAETTGYPTQKPLSLLERIVRATTAPGDSVLDPMCGSGTTVVAAARLGRHGTGIDQNPQAVEIARSRLTPNT